MSTSALGFVEAVLAPACRRDAVQSTLKAKLRGKKLLLENAATVALGEARKRRSVTARGSASGFECSSSSSHPGRTPNGCDGHISRRTSRRTMLLSATREVAFEEMGLQNIAWNRYAQCTLASAPPGADLSDQVGRLDWHGARVKVVQSKCEAYASAEGLVLTETKRMLLLIRKDRRMWIPKQGTTVELVLPGGRLVRCDAYLRVSPETASAKEQRRTQPRPAQR